MQRTFLDSVVVTSFGGTVSTGNCHKLQGAQNSCVTGRREAETTPSLKEQWKHVEVGVDGRLDHQELARAGLAEATAARQIPHRIPAEKGSHH